MPMIMIYSEHLYKMNHYIFFVGLLTFRYKIYDLTSGNSTVNAVCKITESHYMKHNLCVENFDFYHRIYEYLDDNHVIYAQKEKIDPRIRCNCFTQ
jgi:hypothetical protein